jgi:hypothetical protein
MTVPAPVLSSSAIAFSKELQPRHLPPNPGRWVGACRMIVSRQSEPVGALGGDGGRTLGVVDAHLPLKASRFLNLSRGS